MEVKIFNAPLSVQKDGAFNRFYNRPLNRPFGGLLKTVEKNESLSNTLGFEGLTKTARGHIFIEPALLGEIAGVKNADIVGEPPAEFVLALKEVHPKENISAEIKNIMKSFTLAAGVLREAEKHSFDGRDFETLQFARMLDEAVSDGNSFGAQNLFQKLLRMQATRQTFSPVLDDAASHIGKAFKEAGILPENASVNLDFLSEGGRGYAFKVSFLDNEGEKLYHDKILKLYRS